MGLSTVPCFPGHPVFCLPQISTSVVTYWISIKKLISLHSVTWRLLSHKTIQVQKSSEIHICNFHLAKFWVTVITTMWFAGEQNITICTNHALYTSPTFSLSIVGNPMLSCCFYYIFVCYSDQINCDFIVYCNRR